MTSEAHEEETTSTQEAPASAEEQEESSTIDDNQNVVAETTTEQFTTKPAPTLPTRAPTTMSPETTTTTTTVGSTKAGGLLRAAIAKNRQRIKEALRRGGEVKRKGIVAPRKDLKALINKRPTLVPKPRQLDSTKPQLRKTTTTTKGFIFECIFNCKCLEYMVTNIHAD